MSVYELKPRFQSLLRPLVQTLANCGVTANQVTVFALLLSIVTSLFIFLAPFNLTQLLVLPVIWLVRMALNAIDGMLAREHGQKSNLGCFLNELCDVVADVVLFLPLLLIPELSSTLILVTLFLFIITEVVGLIAPQIGASRRYDGPMGKSDRALYISLFIIVINLFNDIIYWGNWTFLCLSLLTVITVVQRIRNAIKEVEHV